MDARELRRLRKDNPARAILESRGWYHSFRFPDGTEFPGMLSLESCEKRFSQFPLPVDLTGKRLLDIGAWDGWFSFEAERRGARVVAVDTVEVANFLKVHRKLGSRVDYREIDLFEMPGASFGKFDYVLFLGVLYHTKYPLLALEIVCALTLDVAVVDCFVTDCDTWTRHRDAIPALEFYETDELGGQLDNWFGPSVSCLMAMCRAAGFARVEVLYADNNRAGLACYRRFAEPLEEPLSEPPRLLKVTNTIRNGINFRSTREEYFSWWLEWTGDSLNREDVRLEAGGFGVPAMSADRSDDRVWHVTSRLPPGLDPGWHEARAALPGTKWSRAARIAVDVETRAERVEIKTVCDGRTWRGREIDLSARPAHLSAWIAGLGENADEANTALFANGRKLPVIFVGEADENGARQVNAEWPEDLPAGQYTITARFGGMDSAGIEVHAR
jgi:tRNA (mo5U34)-methyltransferase